MGPLAVLTAIILGSAVAISFGLCAVLVVFWVIRGESEQIGVEIGVLPVYCLAFLTLTGVAGTAMYGLMKEQWWRWRAQGALWVLLVLLGVLYWWR